jgi:hypothetical protein
MGNIYPHGLGFSAQMVTVWSPFQVGQPQIQKMLCPPCQCKRKQTLETKIIRLVTIVQLILSGPGLPAIQLLLLQA